MPQDETSAAEERETEEQAVLAPAISRGPQGIDLPAHIFIVREARQLAGARDVRINQIADLISLDPVLSLELMKVANATFYSADRPPIMNVRTAVVRLGSGVLVDTLDQIAARPNLSPNPVAIQFELLRTLSTQVSVVSQMIAAIAARDMIEVAQTAGLFSYTGHLVACAYLGERYTELTSSQRYSSLAYKLLQDFNFDIRAVQLSYLRMRGVPQELFYALDRDLQCKTAAQAALRFTVQSASELVEAFHSGRWEKLAPPQPLPSKSSIRLLKMSEKNFADLYENVEGYLRRPAQPGMAVNQASQADSGDAAAEAAAQEAISIHNGPTQLFRRPGADFIPGTTNVADVMNQETQFILRSSSQAEEDTAQLSEAGQKMLGLIQEICLKCKSTQDLLNGVMTLLISDGPYSRAALLLLGGERHSATIHTAIGQDFVAEGELPVVDPLSPLSLCLTKINSFNAQGMEDTMSPFGVTSYAVSPIRLKVAGSVVLYADCGLDRSLPMEARKIFRLVVGLLNTLLPNLPGGLPKRTARREVVQAAPPADLESSVQ